MTWGEDVVSRDRDEWRHSRDAQMRDALASRPFYLAYCALCQSKSS